MPRLGSRVRAPLSAPLHFRTVSSGPFSAKWPSGKAEACKAFTPGSNPGFASRQHPGAPAPVLFYICGHGSVGRAQPCQGWGRGFEPRCPLHCISGPSQAVLFRRSGQVVRQRPAKPLPPVRIRASPPGNIRALRRPFCFTYADMAQLVEHNLAKVGVAGSSPVVRSKRNSPATTVAGLFRTHRLGSSPRGSER